jgi:purine-binding chemotaxis protein CheW
MDTITDSTNQILHKRAITLAKKTVDAKSKNYLSIFSFYLAKDRYAIESNYIQKVFPLQDLTPLPGLSPFHLGITSYDRKFISVIKIEHFLIIPDRILSSLNRVILIQINTIQFCILTDRIDGLDWIDPSKISPVKIKESKTDFSLVHGIDDSGRILLKIENLIEHVDFLGGNKCF